MELEPSCSQIDSHPAQPVDLIEGDMLIDLNFN